MGGIFNVVAPPPDGGCVTEKKTCETGNWFCSLGGGLELIVTYYDCYTGEKTGSENDGCQKDCEILAQL